MLGKNTLGVRTGRPEQVAADGSPEWLPIGVTVAWDSITAATVASELADGTQLRVGEKAIERGTVMVPITTAEVQTVDLSAGDDPTAGTWDLTILGQTVENLAWNASAAVVQAAINALNAEGASGVTVSKAGFVYTITFPDTAGNATAVTVDSTSLTGATSVVVATPTPGVADGGKWAPVDTSLSNGRQTMTRSRVGILNTTIKDSESVVLGVDTDTDLVGLISGGLVWRERLNVGGTNEPTLANLLTAMPRLELTPAE